MSQVIIKKNNLSLKIEFVLANSADPDELPIYMAFHLGVCCLQKYMCRSVQSAWDQRCLY